jgi:nucleoid-associated protein YgaU
VEAVSQPTHYTIRRGDTLIGISLRNYGSNSKVSEICSLNGITDPDDIKIGQEILLP